ncbi:Translation initiation factor SUI1 [Candidatus Burarchaeum australiense]|nr:Translation initiation factor SUI1 [Candidatus Burarchaeum australiense]
MSEICPKCGLPLEICACEALEKEESKKIKVFETKKKFRKLVTIIEGLDDADLSKTAKDLKQKLACGGTAKDGMIVLQGAHKEKVKGVLVSLGYLPESINVV